MEESVTCQAILEKGRLNGMVEGERLMLLHLGEHRFGPPTAEVKAALEAISDTGRVDSLAERMLDVDTWQELLATP
jgi:hypothetical protein